MYIVFEKETGRITGYTEYEDQAFAAEGHDILITEDTSLLEDTKVRAMVDVENKVLIEDPTFVYTPPIDPFEENEDFMFESAIRRKQTDIKEAFENSFISGSFFSETLQIDVDFRRNGINNDLQNVEGLIRDYANLLPEEKHYVGLTETTSFTCTLEQLEGLALEMSQHGRALYKKKWMLEEQIETATRIEDLEDIHW